MRCSNIHKNNNNSKGTENSYDNGNRFNSGIVDNIGGRSVVDIAIQTATTFKNKSSRNSDIGELKTLLLNARSIRNKLSELKAISAQGNYDIIAITESWINTSKDFVSEFDIPVYNIIFKERKDKKGGGVILYYRSHLKIEQTDLNTLEGFEIITANLKCVHIKLKLCIVYRPPSQTDQNDVLMYTELSKEINNKNVIIMGDFNCPDINTSQNNTPMRQTQNLKKFIDDNFLFQMVNEPTRGANVLDLVMASNANFIENLTVREPLGNSDHNMISFNIKIRCDGSPSNIKIPNFKKANFNEMRQSVRSVSWDSILNGKDVNSQWETFKTIILNAQEKFVPLKAKRDVQQNKPKWYNGYIAQLINNRNIAHKEYKQSNSNLSLNKFIDSKRLVKRAIRNVKRSYEINLSKNAKGNPKKFYDYANRKNPIKSTIGPILNNNGSITYDSIEMCNILNNYFASVFKNDCNDKLPDYNPVKTFTECQKLKRMLVTEDEVKSLINKLKTTKAAGPDGIHPILLKELKDILAKPLTIIFNNSIATGTIPEDFKLANVTPIFKKGDKKLAANYRPISLTSICCKILETILRNYIMNHLTEHRIIRESQHGFRNKKSCLTNLLEFFDSVINDYDECKAVDIVYLDFKKAFDLVPHNKLELKLKSHGIEENILIWIKEWLTDRKQRVVINGVSSDYINVTSGVPQGSVLGPILFLIYVNDLDANLINNIAKFADDTKISSPAANIQQCSTLQRDLDNILNWSNKWGMQFNIDKCKSLHVGSNNIRFSYSMGNSEIGKTSEHKDLGVIVDDNLKFSKQCIEAAKKGNKILGCISRTFDYKSKDIILPLYKSLVRPHLDYAAQFWNPFHRKDNVGRLSLYHA